MASVSRTSWGWWAEEYEEGKGGFDRFWKERTVKAPCFGAEAQAALVSLL